MFIEGLRKAKNKWRILVGVLMGLIIISLLATFSYAGRSVNVSDTNTGDGTILSSVEETAKSAGSAAKKADGDITVQGDAAAAYLNLAAYQDLYLEDSKDSYEKALEYAQNMVEACGSAKDPDYATAYGYEFSAYQGLGDEKGLSDAFNESLSVVDIDESFLNSYYSAMSGLKAYDAFIADMDAVTKKLEALAKEEPAAEEDKTTEDTEDTEDSENTDSTADSSSEDMTASELLEVVSGLVDNANAAAAEK